METRKNVRLKDYDYSRNGVYFVTVCSKDRRNIFGEIVGGDVLIAPCVKLSDIGCTVEKVLQSMPAIQKYVIMPNHLHFIANVVHLKVVNL